MHSTAKNKPKRIITYKNVMFLLFTGNSGNWELETGVLET